MVTTEIVMSVGLFIVQMIIAVYLIRYSNQQLMKSISSLRDKNLELMKLNARLTKTVIMNEDSFRKELNTLHGKGKAEKDTTTVHAAVKAK